MQKLRAMLRRLRAEASVRSGASRRDRARLDGNRAVVLGYHRVLPRSEAERLAVEPGMFVTPDTFARQLQWLRQHFEIVPLGEIVARLARGVALPRGACAITFDDGWRDNYQYAWPALRAAGAPATIFLVTARVGTAGAFWPDEVCRRLRTLPARQRAEQVRAIAGGASRGGTPEEILIAHLKGLEEPARQAALGRLAAETAQPECERELLSWEEVGEMARGDIDFESHGETHAILTTLDDASRRAELEGARATLRERGLGRHDLLAYPNGSFDAAVAETARRCGIRAAFTAGPGLVSSACSPLAMPRVLLHEDVSATSAEFLYRVPGRIAG